MVQQHVATFEYIWMKANLQTAEDFGMYSGIESTFRVSIRNTVHLQMRAADVCVAC